MRLRERSEALAVCGLVACKTWGCDCGTCENVVGRILSTLKAQMKKNLAKITYCEARHTAKRENIEVPYGLIMFIMQQRLLVKLLTVITCKNFLGTSFALKSL
jgi:hypothetical protein